MRTFQLNRILRIGFLAVLLAAMLPGTIAAQEPDTETSHTFDEFDVTVAWEDDWNVITVEEATLARVNLDFNAATFVQVVLFDAAIYPPQDAIDLVVMNEENIVQDNRDDEIPSFTQQYEDFGLLAYWEAYISDDGATTILVSLEYVPVLKEASIENAMSGVTINGNSPYRGAILGEDDATDLTGDATPQTDVAATPEVTSESTEVASPEATEETSRTSRTPRGGSDVAETPEATEEPDVDPVETAEPTEEPGVITRTPRGGSDASETPEATEEPDAEPTEEPEDTTLSQGLDSYTSELYGFTISFDPNIWQMGETLETSTVDGVQLNNDRSTVFFLGTSEYGADPVGCLVAEDEYYSTNSDSISNWEVATGSDGEPLWYESDELAWGVFRYTFTSSDGSEVEFVDYISCETIPGEDAVLLVQLTSTPEDYNNNLDAVLDVLDTIEFQP